MPEVLCLTFKIKINLLNVVRISTCFRIGTIMYLVYTDIHYLFSGGGFPVDSLLNKLTLQYACLCHIDDKEVHLIASHFGLSCHFCYSLLNVEIFKFR